MNLFFLKQFLSATSSSLEKDEVILGNLSWFPTALGLAKVSLPGYISFQSAQEITVRVMDHAPKWTTQDLTSTEPGTLPSPAPCPPQLSPAAPRYCRLWGPHCTPARGNQVSTSHQDYVQLCPRHTLEAMREKEDIFCAP